MIVLSHFTITPLLAARQANEESVTASLDLGLSESEVRIEKSGAGFPNGQNLSWEALEEIARTETTCFLVQANQMERVQIYSPEFERFYSLYPTRGAPTMMAASFPMHRIKDTDPRRDTLLKVKTISPVFGEALDTCTGLGYTAIEMARTASRVTTIEIDPAVHEICRRNPWSAGLFTNPRIESLVGDARDLIEGMPDDFFARIIHDPPTLQLAGELYSGEMYRHLFRTLKRGGRLFHYIGDLNSPFGRSIAKGAARRLQDAGFTVTRRPEAFGLLGAK